jgi:glycosyltransferase involved in cell wall biosynthesis
MLLPFRCGCDHESPVLRPCREFSRSLYPTSARYLHPMKASVVIVTKNRKDDLRRAIASATRQTELVEIIIIDDGSSDGTADMVTSEFPQVRLEQAAVSLGYIAQRNRGASICSGDIIFSIDDDAEFSTASVVGQTLQAFSHDRVAAVAIPYTEPHKSPCTFQIARDVGFRSFGCFTDTFPALPPDQGGVTNHSFDRALRRLRLRSQVSRIWFPHTRSANEEARTRYQFAELYHAQEVRAV